MQYFTFKSGGEREVCTLVLGSPATVMSCIDPSVRIVTNSLKVGPLYLYSPSLWCLPIASRRQWVVAGRLPDILTALATRCARWRCRWAGRGSRYRAAPPQSADGAGWAPLGSGSPYTCTVRCPSHGAGRCTAWPLGRACGIPLHMVEKAYFLSVLEFLNNLWKLGTE